MSEHDEGMPPPPRWYGGGDRAEQPVEPSGDQPAPVLPPAEPLPGREDVEPLAAGSVDEFGLGPAEPVDQLGDEAEPLPVSPGSAARAAGSAMFGRDLIMPAPPIWPFGRRARSRREQREQIRQRARDRRAELRRGSPVEPIVTDPARWRRVDPRRNALVITGLAAVVLVVLVLAWWFTGRPQHSAPTAVVSTATAPRSAPTATSSALATTPAGAGLPKLSPIPSGGVAPISPPAGGAINPAAVSIAPAPTGDATPAELGSPAGAVSAWLGRTCPFNYHDPFGAAEQRGRSAMTAAGWAQYNPAGNQRAAASWSQTVAAHEVGQCGAPTAAVDPEAPHTDTSAIVIGEIQRVVTGDGESPYVETVDVTRVVLRGSDGLWRVDLSQQAG